jgi:hypothetical protein
MKDMESKLTVKKMILNKIDSEQRGYAEILAGISGYANGSALRKVLKDEKKEFENINYIIKIVEHFWKNDHLKVMADYSKEIDPNKKTARNLLEYLATNRQFEAFNDLINRMLVCANKESIEWAKIYSMEMKYQSITTKEESNELIQEINKINVTFKELEVYKKILIHYCCYIKEDYSAMKYLFSQIKEEIELINNNDYIKEKYSIKVIEVTAYTKLFSFNEQELARKCVDWILESSATSSYMAYANYIKGSSYTFSSYDNAIKYLNKSMEIYEELNRKKDVEDIEQEIEFINVYWDKNIECKFIKNELFMKVKNGKKLSEEELNNAELDQEFKLFLEGCNNKDNNKLLLSLIKFIKKNNLFLANLPKIELLKNGYNQEIISEMVSINIA